MVVQSAEQRCQRRYGRVHQVSKMSFGDNQMALFGQTVVAELSTNVRKLSPTDAWYFFSCIAERVRDIVGQQLEVRKREGVTPWNKHAKSNCKRTVPFGNKAVKPQKLHSSGWNKPATQSPPSTAPSAKGAVSPRQQHHGRGDNHIHFYGEPQTCRRTHSFHNVLLHEERPKTKETSQIISLPETISRSTEKPLIGRWHTVNHWSVVTVDHEQRRPRALLLSCSPLAGHAAK